MSGGSPCRWQPPLEIGGIVTGGGVLQGGEWAQLRKALREGPGAARETSLASLPSFVCLHPQPVAHRVFSAWGPV